MLSLREAIESNKLAEFISQEEARGVGPINRAQLDRAIAKIVKAPQSKCRTSRSPSHDGSSGKKIPRGNGSRASR